MLNSAFVSQYMCICVIIS